MASDSEELRRGAWAADKAGRTEEALAIFRRIVAEYPNTPAASDAWQYLAGKEQSINRTVSVPVIQLVRVVDFDIGFMNMVGLFIKAAIAIIPAAIIVGVVVGAVVAGLTAAIR